MTTLNLVNGDEIMYSSAAGVRKAFVRGVHVGPTAKRGHSIPWLKLTIMPTKTKPFPEYVTIPADEGSLKMFQVTKV